MHNIPTESEIQESITLLKLPREEVTEILTRKLQQEAARLEAFMPKATAQVEKALEAAEAAARKAQDALESRRELLAGIETRVNEVVRLRRELRAVLALQLDANDAQALAHQTIDFHLLNQGPYESKATISAYRNCLEALAVRQSLAPHIPSYAANIEAKIESAIAAVQAAAIESKFDLRGALELFASEAEQRGQPIDASLFEGIAV